MIEGDVITDRDQVKFGEVGGIDVGIFTDFYA